MRRAFDTSYAEIHRLALDLSEDQILISGHFAWTRRNALVTYLGANTASHYRTAGRILKRWLRSRGGPSASSRARRSNPG